MNTSHLALYALATGTLLGPGCTGASSETGTSTTANTESATSTDTASSTASTAPTDTASSTATASSSTTTSSTATASSTGETETTGASAGLHAAFEEFDKDNVEIYLDGSEVVLSTNGFPNHTTPYWGENHELYVEPQDGWEEHKTPSLITGSDGSFTLMVPAEPELADSPSATPLDVIGLSVSGAAIFNEQEGMGILSEGVAAGLDYSGGHIGPGRYHYHTEPKAFSDDDDSLIGVLTDGFFIYGRKCSSVGGYPDDLDEAGGHTCPTQYSEGPEYHYHIENILFLDAYYIIFDGDFQGTPGTVQ